MHRGLKSPPQRQSKFDLESLKKGKPHGDVIMNATVQQQVQRPSFFWQQVSAHQRYLLTVQRQSYMYQPSQGSSWGTTGTQGRGRESESARESDRTWESRRVRGGDAGGYQRDNRGQKVDGPSRRNVEIKCAKDSKDLPVGCAALQGQPASREGNGSLLTLILGLF